MRLIDADALKGDFREWLSENSDYRTIPQVIDGAPTIEAEPVRHGRWIEKPSSVKYCSHSECSVCSSWQGERWMNYCPNCGAKMDAKEVVG